MRSRLPGGRFSKKVILLKCGQARVCVVTCSDAKPCTSIKLERIGKPRGSGTASADDRITDGAVSPDGAWVVLRTAGALSFHRAADLFSGDWSARGRVDLGSLKEPQGEGVTFGDASTVYLVGEGGGKRQPGTFARLTCTF